MLYTIEQVYNLTKGDNMPSPESSQAVINPGSFNSHLAQIKHVDANVVTEYSELLQEFRDDRARQLGVTTEELHNLSETEIQQRLGQSSLGLTQ